MTLLMLALAWAVVVAPMLEWHADLTRAVESRGALASRMAIVAERLPDLRRQALSAAGTAPDAGALLVGSTDSLAGAALQVRVGELAAQAQVKLSSIETLAADAAGAFRRIGVRVSTTCVWPVLVGFLREIEQASPRMLVDDLQLQAALAVSAGDPGGVTRPLNVTLTVFAFRADAPPPASPPPASPPAGTIPP